MSAAWSSFQIFRRTATLACGFLVFAAHGGTLAQFRTVWGDIEVELLDSEKPVTVANFKRYVQAGLYQDAIFHRATALPQVLVAQGGWLTVSNRANPTNFGIYALPTFAPIVNEFTNGGVRSNTYGTLAMAKVSGNPNSATSQFYFNLTNNSALDDTNNNGGFTVFGRVVRGTNVLNKLNAADPGTGIIRVFYTPNLQELPLLVGSTPPLTPAQLVFVDISLLSVAVTHSNGLARISWNSVSNRLNAVEFTTNFPPAWQTLLTTNGNGARFTITDTNAGAARFYRVRAAF